MAAQRTNSSAAGTRPVAGEIVAVTTTTFTAQSYTLNEAPPFGSLLRIPAARGARRRAAQARNRAAGGYDERDGGRLAAGAPVGAYRIRPDAGAGIAAYYALCYGSETGSIEPGRHAVAWGHFEDDEDDIYRRHPQLTQVLRTTFDALLVGYDTEDMAGGADVSPVPDITETGEQRRRAPAPPAPSSGVNGHAPGAGGMVPTSTVVMAPASTVVMGEMAAEGSELYQRVPATPPHLHAVVYQATPQETVRFNENLTYLRFILRANLPLADDFIAATITHAYEAGGRDEAFLLNAARAVARLLGAEHERVMNILELLDG